MRGPSCGIGVGPWDDRLGGSDEPPPEPEANEWDRALSDPDLLFADKTLDFETPVPGALEPPNYKLARLNNAHSSGKYYFEITAAQWSESAQTESVAAGLVRGNVNLRHVRYNTSNFLGGGPWKAAALIRFSENPTDGQTVTADGVTYTFRDALTGIEANARATLILVTLPEAGDELEIGGRTWVFVDAIDDGLDNIILVDPGFPATAESTGSTGNPADAATIEIDGKTYTIQTSLTNSDGNVLRGANRTETMANLIAAINLEAGAGTLYAAATTANTTVRAEAIGDDIYLEAITAADEIEITESFPGSFDTATREAPSITEQCNIIRMTLGGSTEEDIVSDAITPLAGIDVQSGDSDVALEVLAAGGAGNAITISTTIAGATLSGATFKGGMDDGETVAYEIKLHESDMTETVSRIGNAISESETAFASPGTLAHPTLEGGSAGNELTAIARTEGAAGNGLALAFSGSAETLSPTTGGFADEISVGIYQFGELLFGGDNLDISAAAWVQEDETVGVAVDLTAGKLWVRGPSGWASGDPEAGTDPTLATLPTGVSWTVAAMAGADDDADTMGGKVIGGFGESYVYEKPAGFNDW